MAASGCWNKLRGRRAEAEFQRGAFSFFESNLLRDLGQLRGWRTTCLRPNLDINPSSPFLSRRKFEGIRRMAGSRFNYEIRGLGMRRKNFEKHDRARPRR